MSAAGLTRGGFYKKSKEGILTFDPVKLEYRAKAGDAYAPKHWPQQFVHYANTYGKEKVMFGTDWPVIDPERAVREIDDLGMRDESKQLMMRDNALRVFNLPG